MGRLGGGPWQVVLGGDLVKSSNVSLDASSMITEGNEWDLESGIWI